jgi:hypothetical protein
MKLIEFGTYPQDRNGGVKKILWRVIENKNGTMLLLSDCVLDMQPWNKTTKDIALTRKESDILSAVIPWEQCTLRAWLNNEFYNKAFTPAEKSRIIERLNTGNGAYIGKEYEPRDKKRNGNTLNEDTFEKYEERGCRDTKDKVFLLNAKECIDFFDKSYNVPNSVWYPNQSRLAKATDYALSKGAHPFNGSICGVKQIQTELVGGVKWWLRNIGANDASYNNARFHNGQISQILQVGTIDAGGILPIDLAPGVRPAILIKA